MLVRYYVGVGDRSGGWFGQVGISVAACALAVDSSDQNPTCDYLYAWRQECCAGINYDYSRPAAELSFSVSPTSDDVSELTIEAEYCTQCPVPTVVKTPDTEPVAVYREWFNLEAIYYRKLGKYSLFGSNFNASVPTPDPLSALYQRSRRRAYQNRGCDGGLGVRCSNGCVSESSQFADIFVAYYPKLY